MSCHNSRKMSIEFLQVKLQENPLRRLGITDFLRGNLWGKRMNANNLETTLWKWRAVFLTFHEFFFFTFNSRWKLTLFKENNRWYFRGHRTEILIQYPNFEAMKKWRTHRKIEGDMHPHKITLQSLQFKIYCLLGYVTRIDEISQKFSTIPCRLLLVAFFAFLIQIL